MGTWPHTLMLRGRSKVVTNLINNANRRALEDARKSEQVNEIVTVTTLDRPLSISVDG